MSRQATFIMKLRDKVSGPAQRIRQAVGRVPDAFRRANRLIMRYNDRLREHTDRTWGGIGSTIRNAVAAGAVLAFGADITRVTAQVEGLDNAIRFASGSEAAANFAFLSETTERLGLDALSAKQGFATLAGSFMGTALEGEPMRELFLGVSSAVGALGISADDAQGTFIALGQIMSKGKVQAEELRGQLGERIPGAFQIAARAMGMTTQELDKALSTGKVLAEDFLPLFAKELQNTFGGAALENANSLQARLNRLQNRLMAFKLEAFAALEPLINGLIAAGTYILQHLGPAFQYITDLVNRWGLVIAVATGFLIGYKVAVMAIAAATKAWAFVQALLNGTLAVSPIGLVIGLIAALVAAVVYAYIKFDTFRGIVNGLFDAIKAYFGQIKDLAVAVGNIVVGALTFDKDQIMRGVEQFKDVLFNGGKEVASRFAEGYNRGVAEEVQVPDFLKGVSQAGRSNSQLASTLEMQKTLAGAGGPGGSVSGQNSRLNGGTSVQGDSGKARIINVRIENINTNVAAVDRGGRSLSDLADEVARILVGAARDAEIVLSNG